MSKLAEALAKADAITINKILRFRSCNERDKENI